MWASLLFYAFTLLILSLNVLNAIIPPNWDYRGWATCYNGNVCTCDPSNPCKSRTWSPDSAPGCCPLPRSSHKSKGLIEVACIPCSDPQNYDYNYDCTLTPELSGFCVIQETSTTTEKTTSVTKEIPETPTPGIDVKEIVAVALAINVAETFAEKIVHHEQTETIADSELSTGAIAGIAVGCVVFVGAAVGLIFLLQKHRQKNKPVENEVNTKTSTVDVSCNRNSESFNSERIPESVN